MNDKQSQPILVPFVEQEEKINFRKYIMLFLSHWYWFVLAVFLALGTAWLYHRFTQPSYAVAASLFINENKGNNPLSGGATNPGATDLFEGFGLFQGKQNMENQIQILQSYTLISKTIDDLNFDVSYYSVDWGVQKELYPTAPFRVEWDPQHWQLIGAMFEFEIDPPDDKFKLHIIGEEPAIYDYQNQKIIRETGEIDLTFQVKQNSLFSQPEFAFRIVPQNGTSIPAGKYRFQFQGHKSLVNSFRSHLTVANVNPDATILTLKMQSNTPAKSIDFLNKLMEVYQQQNLDKKNEMATRTIRFINSQLSSVSDSLASSEQHREQFQSRNNLLNISYQSEQLLDQTVTLEQQKEQLTTQQSYYQYLLDYLKSSNDLKQITAPATAGIEDPMMMDLLQNLASQTLDLNTLETTVKDKNHPTLQQLRSQIELTKKALIENSSSRLQQTDMALNDITKRLKKINRLTEKLPGVERNFINIERRYRLNSDTYTFLLQKLSEAKIAKASNTPDNDIIDPAMITSNEPVTPKKRTDYLLALFLGLAVPAGSLLLVDWLDNKVRSEDEVKKLTDLPILANIPHAPEGNIKRTSVLDTPNSPVGEAYRALRHKLRYLTKGRDKTVVAITSTGPMEGKTFSALSTAASFALMGRKTVLLDLDLRRSTLAEELHLPKNTGVSSYLLGEHSLDAIIFNSYHARLNIIPSGDYPPNPGELLADDKLAALIEDLKQRYEVVVIDSAPLLVADIFQYAEQVDGLIYVIRQAMTERPALEKALEELKRQRLKHVGIIYNDIHPNRFGADYGYGYSYGYDYKNTYNKLKLSKLESWIEGLKLKI